MTLPMTSALSRIADEQGFDLSDFERKEMAFERKVQELMDWLRDTRLGDASRSGGRSTALRAEPVALSQAKPAAAIASEAEALGEFLLDVKADIPEPTCSTIDHALSEIKHCRKLADQYVRSMPDEGTLNDFVRDVDSALWGLPDDLEALRMANAQLRDAVCHLGSYCHDAGKMLLALAAATGTAKTRNGAECEASQSGGREANATPNLPQEPHP